MTFSIGIIDAATSSNTGNPFSDDELNEIKRAASAWANQLENNDFAPIPSGVAVRIKTGENTSTGMDIKPNVLLPTSNPHDLLIYVSKSTLNQKLISGVLRDPLAEAFVVPETDLVGLTKENTDLDYL